MNELSAERVYTVKELSIQLDVPDRTMRDVVKRLYPNLTSKGIKTYLTELQVSEISKELKRSHNVDVASTRHAAVTDIELIERSRDLMFDLTLRLKQADDEIKALKPKADFYDQVAGSKDAIDMGSAAKVLNIKGIGRNKLFDILRDKEILMQNNQPYQRYVDSGYFRTIEQKFTKPDGSTHINIKTVVYQKGLDFIRKQVSK